MTLLDSITAAAAAAAAGDGAGEALSAAFDFPIVLNPDDIIPHLAPLPQTPNGDASLVKRVSGWHISPSDADLADLSAQLAKTLVRKLGNPRSLDRAEFLRLLGSFLARCAERIGLSIQSEPSATSDEAFVRLGVGKLGFLIGRELARLIAESCIVLDQWGVLETLISNGILGHLNSVNLVEKLVEKKQSELLALYVKHVSDLRSSELVALLKYFLSPSEDSYESMIGMRKKLEKEALLAIEKATTQTGLPKKVSNMARDASVVLMMAHDGFSAPEICLHYVLGSSNVDGLVMSSAISRLDGSEVLTLIRYCMKWLEKYKKFPDAGPCPSAGAVLGLSVCESIPSLESVVRVLGLVLDVHFSYLVLNSAFHDEVRALEEKVSSLALEADLCCSLDEVVKHLQAEASTERGL
uniref:Uncharacterized protein n=1 Tax=Ananas comosus var. bracteatus TaxID=296719 RepID=A0A6V7Q5R9_ANACO|nr:unnamed protein product [Ananas comosus var. bracteatus]